MIRQRGKTSWEIRIYLGKGIKPYVETFHSPVKSLVQERERELKKKFRVGVGGPNREINDSWATSGRMARIKKTLGN